MNIVQINTGPKVKLAKLANGIKDVDTQLRQLHHLKGKLLDKLSLFLDVNGEIYEDGVLVAKKSSRWFIL